MRRVWVAVLTVWALVAIVAVLAWAHAPTNAPSATRAVVVHTKGGASQVVLVPAGGVHGTTQTSPAAAPAPASAGTPISLVSSAPAAGGRG